MPRPWACWMRCALETFRETRPTNLGIIVSVWLNPAVTTIKDLDHQILFDIHRKATSLAIHKAMAFQPSIDWLLENQDKVIHKYFEKGLKGEI